MFILELNISYSLDYNENVLTASGYLYQVISEEADRYYVKKVIGNERLSEYGTWFHKEDLDTVYHGGFGCYILRIQIDANIQSEVDTQKVKEQWIKMFRNYLNKEQEAINNRLDELLSNNSGKINV